MRISPKQFMQGLLYAAPILLLALASCGGGGGSSTTTPPVVAPSAPTGLAATTGCSAINLNWSAVAGATGYNVYGAASSVQVITVSNKLTSTPDTATSYTDTSATLNNKRYYQITAVNSAGESPGSNVANGTITVTCSKVGGSVQGNALSLTNAVSTMAGTAGKQGYVDTVVGPPQFNNPASITTDGTNLYVADAGNNVIRKIVIATGVVSTVAGTGVAGYVDTAVGVPAQFNGPQGITSDGTYLYVADTGNNAIRKIDNAGTVTTLVGNTLGTFSSPAAITYDGISNLYVADSTHNLIKMLTTAGVMSTTFSVSVTSPQGITYAGSYLYVTSGNSIYQVTTTGAGTATLLTSGSTVLQGITSDGTYLYVANTGSHTILMTPILSPLLSLVAGTSGTAGSTDGTGSAARFRFPGGITTDGTNLYITDTGNQTIRKIQ